MATVEGKRGVLHEQRVNVIVPTALAETDFVKKAFDMGMRLTPQNRFDTNKMLEVIRKLGIIA